MNTEKKNESDNKALKKLTSVATIVTMILILVIMVSLATGGLILFWRWALGS